MAQSFRDLQVWQRAMQLTVTIYRLTQSFPREERYGLTNQLRRSAVSIPSNIAEGQGRLSEKEFRYFLGQARCSLTEVETQMQIAENLGYLQKDQTAALLQSCAEVGRILNGLVASVSKQTES